MQKFHEFLVIRCFEHYLTIPKPIFWSEPN